MPVGNTVRTYASWENCEDVIGVTLKDNTSSHHGTNGRAKVVTSSLTFPAMATVKLHGDAELQSSSARTRHIQDNSELR